MSKDSIPPGHPPIGALIDQNSLQLVEVLGTGGYGVVYRAIDTYSRHPRSYAVKCLAETNDQARRTLHKREIALHQLASSHPSVVTLQKVVRENGCLFLVMDYARDGDLFSQILSESTYLGQDSLIRRVFLQIIDAVQHCHSLGIYHRDLKPENVLCFDGGYRVAITDFGLATVEKSSKEFRTGSIYHMSPECQWQDPRKSSASYSPLHNDVWSLGIILLNLTTGRNPWKSATQQDPTFQAYRRNPRRFLKNVLPISEDLNDILEGALAVDPRERISLSEMRQAMKRIRNFYSDDVVFTGNLATCPWERGFTAGDSGSEKSLPETPIEDVQEYYMVSGNRRARRSSEITVLEGLDGDLDEPVEWDGVHSEYEDDYERQGAVFWDSPVHSTYEPDAKSDSDESEFPATPISEYCESSRPCSVVNSVLHTPLGGDEDERTFCESVGSHPYSPADDASSYVTSAFNGSSLKSRKTEFKTRRRYSSPNTSVYSIAEESETLHEIQIGAQIDQQRGMRSGRAQPLTIPRTKSKAHMFGSMRFFPRSAGTSWLNSKPTSTRPAQAQSTMMEEVDTYASRQDFYMRPRPVPPITGRSSRAMGSAVVGQANGNWLPHFFSSFAAA